MLNLLPLKKWVHTNYYFLLIFLSFVLLMTSNLRVAGASDPSFEKWPHAYFNLDDVVMSMKKTECYGPCPVYEITINGDGAGEYYGEKYVNTMGKVSFNVTNSDVMLLLDKIYQVRFFDFVDSYESKFSLEANENGGVQVIPLTPTDMPTSIITVKIGNYTKSVSNYYNAPDGLKEVEDNIDGIARSYRWLFID